MGRVLYPPVPPSAAPLRSCRRLGAVLALGGMLQLAWLARSKAENRLDYRYEDYAEDGDRIHVRTHGAYAEVAAAPWLSVKGNYIHDAISGATPTGAPPIPGEKEVAKARMEDTRQAGYLEPAFLWQAHTLSPQLAYSHESDYESVGLSLTDALELNEKNTTLSFGISHTFDRVLPSLGASIQSTQTKDNTDALLGVTQLLGPNTVLTANLTLGYADGYLSDPYKRVLFDDFPYNPGQPYTVWPEHRPGHKLREVVFLSVRQFIQQLNGALDVSYRFHHDDFGIAAHTATVEWHQNLGRRVQISPLFRYHTQTAADFYATHFPGDPSLPGAVLPDYYSADYRLSALNSFTYGVGLTGKVHDYVSLNVSYKRYHMAGTDGRTAADQYPSANIFGGGVTIWF